MFMNSEEPSKKKKGFLRLHLKNHTFHSVKIKKIVCIVIRDEVCVFYVEENKEIKEYPVTHTLTYWLKVLDDDRFLHIHKSHAINAHYIDCFSSDDDFVKMTDSIELEIARDRRHVFDGIYRNYHPKKKEKETDQKSTLPDTEDTGSPKK